MAGFDFDDYGPTHDGPPPQQPQPAPEQPQQSGGGFSFDDYGPTQGAGPPGGGLPPDHPPVSPGAQDEGADEGIMQSGPAAAVRGFIRGAVPSIGAAAGSEIGFAGGAGLGAPLGPVGSFATGVAGATVVGMAGAQLAKSAQDFLVNELGLENIDSVWDPFSTAQTQRDIQQHPEMTKAGDIGSTLVGFGANPTAFATKQGLGMAVGMGAGAAGGNVVTQLENTGEVDPIEAGLSGLVGGAFPRARFGVSRFMPGRPNVEATPQQAQEQAKIDQAQDVTPVAPGVAAENTKVKTGMLPPEDGASSPGLATVAAGPTDGRKDAIKQSAPTYTTGDPAKGGAAPEIWQALQGMTQREGPAEQAPAARPQQPAPEGPQQPPVTGPVTPEAPQQQQPQQPVNIQDRLSALTQGVPPAKPQRPAAAQVALDQLRSMGTVERPGLPPVHGPMLADALEQMNLPPGQLTVKARQAVASLQSKTGTGLGTASRQGLPYKKPLVEGMVARGPADAAIKQRALNAAKQAYEKFGPDAVQLDPNDPDAARKVAFQATEVAKQLNGGQNPIDTYRRQQNAPPYYKWMQAATKVSNTVNGLGHDRAVQQFLQAHALKGDVGPKVDAEIAMKPQREAANVQQPASPENEPVAQTPREPFPMLDSSIENYKDHNLLRRALNRLSDSDYSALQEAHGVPLETEVNTTHDPASLRSELLQDAATAKKQQALRYSRFEYPAEGGVEKPITKASDLPEQKPQRWEDLMSPQELAEFNKRQAVMSAKSPQEIAQVTGMREADGSVSDRANDMKSIADRLKAFASDQSGAGRPMFGWAMPSQGNPNTDPHVKEMMNSIDRRLTRTAGGMDAAQSHVFDLTRSVPPVDTQTPGGWLPSDFRRVYRAIADRTTDQLPDRERDFYENIIKPMQVEDERAGRDLWELSQKYPDLGLHVNEYKDGVQKDSVPRIVDGMQSWQRDPASNPFTTERTFPSRAMSEEDRSYFGLIDSKGNRFIGRENPTEDKTDRRATIFGVKNDAPINGGNFTVGNKIKINGKSYTVDHASAQEIMDAGVKWMSGPRAGEPIKYIEDPSLAYAQSLMQKYKLLEGARFLRDTTRDPNWEANTTTSPDEARAKGWVDAKGRPYAFPDFIKRNGRTIYGDERLAAPMEDFLQEGLPLRGRGINAWRKFGTEMIQSLFAVQPFYHDLNVGNAWATARGFDWLPATGGYRSLVKTVPKALRLAITRGPEYDQYKRMGAPLQLGGTMSSNFIPDLAKRVGQAEGFLREPSRLDPIARILGMSTPDLYRSMKQNSNKITWFISDALTLQKVIENEELHGMSKQKAIDETNRVMPDYEHMTTVLGSRLAAQALQDPATGLFGKYLWGNIRSYAGMISRVTTGTLAQRREAAGQLLVAGLVLSVAYPAMDKAWQAITGNPQARIRRHGLSTIPDAISRIPTEGPSAAAGQVARFSVPVQMLTGALHNDSGFGKPIIQPGAAPGQAASEAAGWALSQLPPVQQGWAAYKASEGDPGGFAARLAGQQVGADIPSPKSTAFKSRRNYYNMKDMRSRLRNPQNPLEAIYNKFTGH